MPLVAGIDEAGYGPVLGPLVVGATLWRTPPEAAGGDFWQPLQECVCRERRAADARLVVDDSKRAYDRKRGLYTLERTVLAFARAAGQEWPTLGALLASCGFDPAAARAGTPWYELLDIPLPTDPTRSAFAGAAARLQAVMPARGVVCRGLTAQVITEDAFNERLLHTRNKAAVLIEQVLRLIDWAAQQSGTQDLHVYVDRLGGRCDYHAVLLRAFPDRHVHILEVSDERSRYRLATQQSDWLIEFRVEADQHYLPVALASMVAKYVRELLMERFNAYWRRLAPALRPTAGYYSDAQRFLADIAPLVEQVGVPRERFVRQR